MVELTIDSLSLFLWLGVVSLIAGLLRMESGRIAFAWGPLITAIGNILGGVLGNRKGKGSKELEDMQRQVLERKLAISKMISPGMIESALNLGKGAVGALPMGFGTAGGSPQNQALQDMLNQFMTNPQNKTSPYGWSGKCAPGQWWDYFENRCKMQGER